MEFFPEFEKTELIFTFAPEMGLKEKLAEKKMSRIAASQLRKRVIPSPDSLKRVGVIWQPEQKDAFLFLQEYFSKRKTIFRSLCVDSGNIPGQADTGTITSKDLDWLGFPKSGKVDIFTDVHYDLLMNIALEQNITTKYITLITSSGFKTGWSADENNFFDLNINISENPDALYLAKQQIFYLGQLNKNEH